MRSWDTAIKEKRIKVNVTLLYEQESAEESLLNHKMNFDHEQSLRNFNRSKKLKEVKKSQAFSVRLEIKKLLMS